MYIILLIGKQKFKKNFYFIVKSLVLSSFGKLSVLPFVIWHPNRLCFQLMNIFILISNSNALEGT